MVAASKNAASLFSVLCTLISKWFGIGTHEGLFRPPTFPLLEVYPKDHRKIPPYTQWLTVVGLGLEMKSTPLFP